MAISNEPGKVIGHSTAENFTTITGTVEFLAREVNFLESNVDSLYEKLASFLNIQTPELTGAQGESITRAKTVSDIYEQVIRVGGASDRLRQLLLRLAV